MKAIVVLKVVLYTSLLVLLIVLCKKAESIGYEYGSHFWDSYYEEQEEKSIYDWRAFK